MRTPSAMRKSVRQAPWCRPPQRNRRCISSPPSRTTEADMTAGGPTIVQRRIAIMALMCSCSFALIGVRLVDLAIIGGHGVAPSPVAHVVASRADLTDRNGELLARDLVVHDLYVHPSDLADP